MQVCSSRSTVQIHFLLNCIHASTYPSFRCAISFLSSAQNLFSFSVKPSSLYHFITGKLRVNSSTNLSLTLMGKYCEYLLWLRYQGAGMEAAWGGESRYLMNAFQMSAGSVGRRSLSRRFPCCLRHFQRCTRYTRSRRFAKYDAWVFLSQRYSLSHSSESAEPFVRLVFDGSMFMLFRLSTNIISLVLAISELPLAQQLQLIPYKMAQIVPSRMNLQLYKQKIIAAKKGHELLKRKADALKAKFRRIMELLLKSKKKMGEECQQALYIFSEAKYAAGDFQNNVKQAVKRACIRLDKTEENIAGVLLPNLTVRELEDNENTMSQIGMERGGQSVQKCRDKFREVLVLLVEIASLQASFVTLDEKIKVTNRRVNALQHVVIPKFQDVYRYIDQQLDEQAKEDFYRLKKVLDNKRKLVEEEQAEKKKIMATTDIDLDEKTQNLLEEFDEDVIF